MEDNRRSVKSEEHPEVQEAENPGRSPENRKKHTRPKGGRNRKGQPELQQAEKKNMEEEWKQATVAIARVKEL